MQQPKSVTTSVGKPVTFIVKAVSNRHLKYQWYKDGAVLAGATSPTLNLRKTSFDQAGIYQVQIDTVTNRLSGTNAPLEIVSQPASLDLILGASIAITSPRAATRSTNGIVKFQGRTSNTTGVSTLEYRLDTSDGPGQYQPVTGIKTWSVPVALVPGTNIFRIRARDTNNHFSAEIARSIDFVFLSTLTVIQVGAGKITPNLNGKSLEVGRDYTLTAAPASGNIFEAWTGSLTSGLPSLTFTMQTNMFLEADFLLNPFPAVKGNYAGLFYGNRGVAVESSGFFTVAVTDQGAFTAKFQTGTTNFSFASQFDGQGLFSGEARIPGARFSVTLQVDLTGADEITGQIVAGRWQSQVIGDRATYDAHTNPAPQAGTYTLLIPGTNDPALGPAGDSFGSVQVDAGGNIQFSGMLAYGTAISQGAAMSKMGLWPFFIALPGGKGSVISWLSFTNRGSDDINGALDWIVPAQPGAPYYPLGFTNINFAYGSAYDPAAAATNRVLPFTNGLVVLTGGNFNVPFTNQVILAADNSISSQSTNALTLSIKTSNGLFTGNVMDPATGNLLSLQGAIYPEFGYGSGFFKGTNQVGRIFFGPE